MFRNILVAIDLEHDADIDNLLHTASEIANSQSASQSAQVHLVHVIGAASAVVSQFLPKSYETMAAKKMEEELSKLAATLDLKTGQASISVRFGDVYQEILAYADKISVDLIVVASHKPNVSDYLLGTTAARIVRHARCSTLVVRQAR